MMRRQPYATATLLLTAMIFTLCTDVATAKKKDEPLAVTKIKGRPGKALFKAAYGRGGRLGTFHDVDGDADLEFIALERAKRQLELSVLQLDQDKQSLSVDLGEAAAAGLVAVNLDNDAALEFIVGHGTRLEGLKKGLVMFGSIVTGTLIGYAQFAAGASVALVPVLTPGAGTTLFDLRAIDDDGSQLWHRDLKAEAAAGAAWNKTRFQWTVPHSGGTDATILITDDAQQALLGLSAADGTTLWSQKLLGNTKASKRSFSALIDDDRLLPVLFAPGEMLILDPVNGEPVFDGPVERGVAALPSWHVFDTGDDKGFLVFGEKRREIRMVGLTSGETLWTHPSEEIREVMPLPDQDQFILVLKEGIQILDATGKVVADRPAPAKIKTKFSPIYRDLNGDGSMEFLFVSGKKILCWNLQSDEVLWSASLATFVGGANPVEIYDAFHDMDGDGWLDVPGKKGSGAAEWLSGKTGEVLFSVGNGASFPIVGDWDKDGLTEIFWFKTWYEVSPAH